VGIGFEKVQMGHIHVAFCAGVGSAGGRRKGLSLRKAGDAVALRDGDGSPETGRVWKDDRLGGLRASVIFGDDFRKPACVRVSGRFNTCLRAHT
jgi:hypothetical protein